jgi:hypothetical protein
MTRLAVLAIAALLAVPPVAAAVTNPPVPSGKYKLRSAGTGSLRVKDKVLTSLSIAPTPDAFNMCAAGTIKLKTTHKLTIAARNGYRSWIVGKNTPKTSSGYSLIKTKVAVGGKTVKAKIKLIWFDDNLKTGDGELVVGACDLYFSFQK